MQRIHCYSYILLIFLSPVLSVPAQENSSENANTAIFRLANAAAGTVAVNVSSADRRPLQTSVRFLDAAGRLVHETEFDLGIGETQLLPGDYQAHVSVAHLGTYFLVDVKPVHVAADDTTYLILSLIEGSASLPLEQFDRDHDLAIDRVELEQGTDPDDPASLPGHERLEWASPVLESKPGWYVGDLHAFSEESIGTESVAKLISRAEKSGLDFLAITDRNTLAHTQNKDFRSRDLVLIPAMEWGSDETGYAILLKPGTVPLRPNGDLHAQSVLDRVVQQGGVFAPAHPCFPTAPWLRTVGFFNAVEIWCRQWRGLPPLSPKRLPESLQAQSEGDYVYPIARAARSSLHSANGQADYFWRTNLNSARKSAAIAGSHSASPQVKLGAPLTHVYAENKSLDAILHGIRRGRTMVSRDANSPRVEFTADALNDGKVETRIGGIVPLRHETRFIVQIEGGRGKRLEVLLNGQPIRTVDIPTDPFAYAFDDTPQFFSNYIVRVTEEPTEQGFGLAEMLVITSPIYAQEIVVVDEETGRSSWVRLEAPPAPAFKLPSPPEQ